MPEQLLQYFSIDIQQKLYEKQTPQGNLAIYQTSPFGIMLMQNGQVLISEADGFFYHEMMTHPALFTHQEPKKIAIIGNPFGILQEVLKHSHVSQIDCVNDNSSLDETIKEYFPQYRDNDARITHHKTEISAWLSQGEADNYDVIIQAEQSEDFLEEHFSHYFRILNSDGILVQPCRTSFLNFKMLKPIYQNARHSGFRDLQLLNFPQPSFPSGWRTLIMATKRAVFKQVKERDVFNRTFTTRYYNFDVHKAALVMPEFMREELGL